MDARRGDVRGVALIVLAGLLLLSGLVWLAFGIGDRANVEEGGEVRAIRLIREKKAKKNQYESRFRKKSSASVSRPIGKDDSSNRVKPDLSLEAEDEARLTGEMKRLYHELQVALDDNREKDVITLIQRLQAMHEWPDDVPKAVKIRALEALSWFGASGMAEAVGFLGDSDPEIVEMSVEKFSDMLSDFTLGDRAISDILKQIVQVVHDRDNLDTFLMEMNNMRNSVRADTALAIFDSGNPDAIAVLQENIDFLFCDNQGDYEVKTRADVENFMNDNPDGEDDEDFYGPSTD